MRRLSMPQLVLGIAGVLVVAAAQAVPPVPAWVVAKQGDALGGSTISTLNTPFTDGNGKVGFVGALADNQRFVWWDTGPVFYSGSALPLVLTGGEGTMGVSDTGGFIYSPSADGNDSVYTHGGLLLAGTQVVPNLGGLISTFNSRPQMLPDGTALWIGGTRTDAQGTTSNRHLFRASDPTDPSTITPIWSGGDLIQGIPIATSASNFTYMLSDNGLNHIHVLTMSTGSSLDDVHVYVNGDFVAQESKPTGFGDAWQNFGDVGIHDHGNYIFAGDTDGPTATDAFVAYNGIIGVREGDTIDGVTLASGAATRAISINNLNQVVHMWGWGSGASLQEHLFFGDGADLANSIRLLSLGDEIDADGDGIADFLLTDFSASTVVGPGLRLAEDGYVFLEVVMRSIAEQTTHNAIIRVAIPEPASLVLLALAGLLLRRR